MLNFFAIVLIIFIVFFLLIFKRKYIIHVLNKKNLSSIREKNIKNKDNISSTKEKDFYYLKNSNNYSEFTKKALRKEMFKLFQGQSEDKLKALNIAEDLSDKSTLPILRLGLKDMNPEIVKLSAILIRKFK